MQKSSLDLTKPFVIGGLLLSVLSAPALADSAAALYEEHCVACHGGTERGPDRVAPPIFAVKGHYLPSYPDKASFVEAIAQWAIKPDLNKVLMPGAVRRFELMPPVEISMDDARKIAQFIYDGKFERPGWYEQHYREEHGEAPK